MLELFKTESNYTVVSRTFVLRKSSRLYKRFSADMEFVKLVDMPLLQKQLCVSDVSNIKNVEIDEEVQSA